MIGNKEEKIEYWSEEIEVNGVIVKFKLDMGVDLMVIGDLIYSCFFSKINF